MKVNGRPGWNGGPDARARPAGLISSIAGATSDALIVVEVGESAANEDHFMPSQLGAVLGQANGPEPTSIQRHDEIIDFHLD